MTRKQKGFVADYAANGNGTQAVLKNYNVTDPEVAKVIASQNLTKLNVLEAVKVAEISLKDALVDVGVTPKVIGEKVKQLLNSDDEVIVDKGLKHATGIYGVLDPGNEKPKTGNTYNFIFNAENQKDINKLNDNIKSRIIDAATQTN